MDVVVVFVVAVAVVPVPVLVLFAVLRVFRTSLKEKKELNIGRFFLSVISRRKVKNEDNEVAEEEA